ncbi:hypothetical protein [Flavobacterium sp.]
MFSKLVGKSTGVMGLAGKARSTGGRATMGVHAGLAGAANFTTRSENDR